MGWNGVYKCLKELNDISKKLNKQMTKECNPNNPEDALKIALIRYYWKKGKLPEIPGENIIKVIKNTNIDLKKRRRVNKVMEREIIKSIVGIHDKNIKEIYQDNQGYFIKIEGSKYWRRIDLSKEKYLYEDDNGNRNFNEIKFEKFDRSKIKKFNIPEDYLNEMIKILEKGLKNIKSNVNEDKAYEIINNIIKDRYENDEGYKDLDKRFLLELTETIIKGKGDKKKIKLWSEISTKALYPEKEEKITTDDILETEYGIDVNG